MIAGFFSSIRKRHIDTPAERMAWLLVLGTIPVGIVGLLFEHNLRTIFAKPTAAAIFLTINGLILLAGERLRRRAEVRNLVITHEHHTDPGNDVGRDLDTLELKEGVFVGSAQILALFAGISRSGVTMVAGLLRGLDHEDAMRLSFMLATPIILAAGVYKLPDLLGSNGDHIRGQVARRKHRRRHRGLSLGPVPRALLQNAHAHAVRHLQPRRRHRNDHLHDRVTQSVRARSGSQCNPRQRGEIHAAACTGSTFRSRCDVATTAVENPARHQTRRCMTVSVLTTVISVATLAIATLGFGIVAWGANILATSVATVPSYRLNRRWTWGKHGASHPWREVLPFWMLAFSGLVLSTIFVAFTDPRVTRLHANLAMHTGAVIGAHLAGFGVLWVVQFVLLDRVLFRAA